MTQDNRRTRHLKLVTRMADALGVDLEAESYAGRLEPGTLEGMVDRCVGCSDPAGCEQTLGAPGSRLAAAPAQCRNAERLVRMMR